MPTKTTKRKPAKKRRAPLPMLKNGVYTVTQVLEHVYKILKERPARLDMRDWVSVWKGEKLTTRFRRTLPECGTVACIAGWITIATTGETCTGSYSAFGALDLYPRRQPSSNSDTIAELREDLNRLFVSDLEAPKEETLRRVRQFIDEHREVTDGLTVEVNRD